MAISLQEQNRNGEWFRTCQRCATVAGSAGGGGLWCADPRLQRRIGLPDGIAERDLG